jgi:hypothetical protein
MESTIANGLLAIDALVDVRQACTRKDTRTIEIEGSPAKPLVLFVIGAMMKISTPAC